jgi:hypothetical protein
MRCQDARSRQQAEQVKARLAQWLAPRGLVFDEDKTRIVHLEEGFNFLGFNLRRYRRGGRNCGLARRKYVSFLSVKVCSRQLARDPDR